MVGSGERIMGAAVFLLPGFDEISHDSGYGKVQIEKEQPHLTHLYYKRRSIRPAETNLKGKKHT